jgi:outer membrane biosynthesis protein TonB
MGGTFHVEVDGNNVSGPMKVNNSGGYQNFQAITKTGINLTAGQHKVRLVIDAGDTTGFAGNFSTISFTHGTVNNPTPTPTPTPTPGPSTTPTPKPSTKPTPKPSTKPTVHKKPKHKVTKVTKKPAKKPAPKTVVKVKAPFYVMF